MRNCRLWSMECVLVKRDYFPCLVSYLKGSFLRMQTMYYASSPIENFGIEQVLST